jgi:hypothetical protein
VKRVLRGLILLGALGGAAVAVRSYLWGGATGEEVVQIVFDDGSTHVLASNTAQGQEFTDIARKIVEMGL